MISLIVSNQSKKEAGIKAFEKLLKLPLTIENVLNSTDEKLEKLIFPINFYKRKIFFIKSISKILKEKYENDLPNNLNELKELPGVGPKIANRRKDCLIQFVYLFCPIKLIYHFLVAMSQALNVTSGIAVDSHVIRVSNRLGWTNEKNSESVRRDLEDWMPL